MRIHDMKKADRPREKARRYGLEKLENAELIALILGHGIKNHSALELAHSLLMRYSLGQLAHLSYSEWQQEKGFQDPQIWRFLATFELAKRVVRYQENRDEILLTTGLMVQKYRFELRNCDREVLVVIMGDKRRHLIYEEVMHIGTSDEIVISINELFTSLLRQNAKCFMLIHNHPLGNPMPSQADYETTLEILKKSRLLHIKFLDHIILTEEEYYSFLEADII